MWNYPPATLAAGSRKAGVLGGGSHPAAGGRKDGGSGGRQSPSAAGGRKIQGVYYRDMYKSIQQ